MPSNPIADKSTEVEDNNLEDLIIELEAMAGNQTVVRFEKPLPTLDKFATAFHISKSQLAQAKALPSGFNLFLIQCAVKLITLITPYAFYQDRNLQYLVCNLVGMLNYHRENYGLIMRQLLTMKNYMHENLYAQEMQFALVVDVNCLQQEKIPIPIEAIQACKKIYATLNNCRVILGKSQEKDTNCHRLMQQNVIQIKHKLEVMLVQLIPLENIEKDLIMPHLEQIEMHHLDCITIIKNMETIVTLYDYCDSSLAKINNDLDSLQFTYHGDFFKLLQKLNTSFQSLKSRFNNPGDMTVFNEFIKSADFIYALKHNGYLLDLVHTVNKLRARTTNQKEVIQFNQEKLNIFLKPFDIYICQYSQMKLAQKIQIRDMLIENAMRLTARSKNNHACRHTQ